MKNMASKIVDNSDMDDVLTTVENLIKAGGNLSIKQHSVCVDCGADGRCPCGARSIHVIKVSTNITFTIGS